MKWRSRRRMQVCCATAASFLVLMLAYLVLPESAAGPVVRLLAMASAVVFVLALALELQANGTAPIAPRATLRNASERSVASMLIDWVHARFNISRST